LPFVANCQIAGIFILRVVNIGILYLSILNLFLIKSKKSLVFNGDSYELRF